MSTKLAALTFATISLSILTTSHPVEAGDYHRPEKRGFALVPPAYYPPAYYRMFYAPPIDLYGYGRVVKPVSVSVHCGWIKRHAINSHSPSWWAKYHRCRM